MLAFARTAPGPGGGTLVCAVNLGPAAVPLPRGADVVLASSPLDPAPAPDAGPDLPPDTAVWYRP